MHVPLGKPVEISTFEDVNLLHDHVTEFSAMGIALCESDACGVLLQATE